MTGSLGARSVAGENGWTVRWLSDDLERLPVAFGLWEGDLTLKCAVEAAMRDLVAEGQHILVRTNDDLERILVALRAKGLFR